MKTNKYFSLISLGCPKNRVDSERILAIMNSCGFVYTDELPSAGVIFVNTCAFIEPAVEESIDTILDCRAENGNAILVVAGCLPLRYREALREPLPEVDLFLLPDKIPELPAILPAILRVAEKKDSAMSRSLEPRAGPRILTTRGYAYLRIAEGCSRRCRYCTIPSIRGRLRSSDPRELEDEAALLVSKGVRELVLVAQDLTSYGLDQGDRNGLIRLLERIGRLEGLQWIRLMYLHPAGIPSGLSRIINESDTILPYLDIPFQHVSETVLRAMGRPWKGDRIRKLVDRLRNQIPGLVLRTTLMVGFPGEGEREFRELRDFVESFRIEHVGVFTYSPEEGTLAHRLGDPVRTAMKEERAHEIRLIHARYTEKRNRARIGTIEECLIEGVSAETDLLLQGRAWDQAPEVDGSLFITGGTTGSGATHTVKLTGACGPDLFGEIV